MYGIRYLRIFDYLSVSECAKRSARENEVCPRRPQMARNQPAHMPPKNGEITLLLPTNSLMRSKHVSQKRNESIDKDQWYNILLEFIL